MSLNGPINNNDPPKPSLTLKQKLEQVDAACEELKVKGELGMNTELTGMQVEVRGTIRAMKVLKGYDFAQRTLDDVTERVNELTSVSDEERAEVEDPLFI